MMKEDVKIDLGRPGCCPVCGAGPDEMHKAPCGFFARPWPPTDKAATILEGAEILDRSHRGLQPTGEYALLELVLDRALAQASGGKGKERHAVDGEPFERQQICEITRRLGHGFSRGQAVKKIYEAQRLPADRAVAELLGAINYIAASIIVLEEQTGE